MIYFKNTYRQIRLIKRMHFSFPIHIFFLILFRFVVVRIYHLLKIKKLPVPPINFFITVTTRCNKNCHFCHYVGELNQEKQSDDLSYNQFIDLLNHPATPSVGRICFYGGEPLLNKDLFLMLNEAKKRNYITSLITNGLQLKERAGDLIDSKVDLISVSYYPEDVEKISPGIALLSDKVVINLVYVFSESRIVHIPKVLAFAISHDIPMVTLENVNEYPTNRKEVPIESNSHSFEKFKISINKIYGDKVIIRWGPLVNSAPVNQKIVCCDPWDTLFINGKGELSGCCRYPLSTYQNSLFKSNQSYNSTHLVQIRNEMNQGLVPKYCTGCCYLYSRDPLYR